ncbi:MAG: baseplate J/gp47 family protein [Candidatus Woesebacteria bacterium]|nr:baseplate J/gp47 family protein [Candidatus Woesebacteria bacterium]
MNLKDFLTSREHPPELYWSIVIEEEWVQAGVWYIGETAAEVVSISPGAAWSTEDELTGAVDAALSSAIQKLPENYQEPNKAVFGVASSWVKGGEIAEEYLGKIKKLCTDLSLNPVGFVVLPEAIAHLCKSEEGSPLNAIILGLGSGKIEISVFKLGNLIGTTDVSRSVSLIEDVTEGLSRFEGAAPLPSRFIVYNGKEGELEEAKETLLQTSWEGIPQIKFLHTPKAEVLSPDRKVLATCLAGAAEIGHVSRVDSKDTQFEEEKTSPVAEVSAENLGFAIGADVSAKVNDIENVVPAQKVEPVAVPPKPSFNPGKIAGEYLQKTKNLFHSFSLKTNAAPKVKNNTLISILVVVVFAMIAGILSWWFLPTAKIVVFVTPKRFEQQVKLSFSSSGVSDATAGIIPAQIITDKVAGDKTKSATGTKLVGNKAAGNVQIANGNGTAINLAAGTLLTSSAGLKFITNSQASVSGQILPGSPGTASIAITAYDIGAQYNLAKGEVFGIGNYSKAMVAGTSLADFSGGSSQEISAVSVEDQTNLETDLKAELTQNAVNDISGKVTADQVFVTDLAGLDAISEKFDHKVGDSADSIKLSLSLNATGIAADRAKLIEYAKGVLNDKTPSGFTLNSDQIDFKFKFSIQQNENYVYDVTIGANFLPQIDIQKTIGQIVGRTPKIAENYFNSISGFGHAEIKLKPNLPGFLGTLPRIPKNITLEVNAEQ